MESIIMAATVPQMSAEDGEAAIARFQKFISFPTVSATGAESGAYRECAGFIREELQSLQVLSDIHFLEESPKESPVVVACWKGSSPELPVVLLNSHYDVVPADLKEWTVPPFEGLRKDGKIYGRGTQDMKCVCMQYVEAIRQLVRSGSMTSPVRSIYLTFVPDEEVGGAGMAAFLDSKLFKSLPGIALALDEGLASTTDTFSVFYGERLPWWIDVTATGNTGHGSRFIENTAVEQLVELANKALAFRKGQRELLGLDSHTNCAHAVAAKNSKENGMRVTTDNVTTNGMNGSSGRKKVLGDVTTLNITTLQAGVKVANTYAYNCVPPTAKCSLDIRISPHIPPKEITEMLDMWCRECGCDSEEASLSWKFVADSGSDLMEHSVTSTDAKVNPWYGVFSDSMASMGLTVEPLVFPAATDSRYLRALGIRALGFSPMRKTEIMLHENDEYIPESTFLEGIGIYVHLVQALGSQGNEMEG